MREQARFLPPYQSTRYTTYCYFDFINHCIYREATMDRDLWGEWAARHRGHQAGRGCGELGHPTHSLDL